MDAKTLLKECEALNHSERVKKMVRLGYLSQINISVYVLINELSSGSLDEQVLSLETCYGSRNMDIALRALSSSSKYLKKRAMDMIPLLGTDEQLLEVLKSAPEYLQIRTLRKLKGMRRSQKRQKVIDMFLEILEQRAGNDPIFQALFPLASRELVERSVPRLLGYFTLSDWFFLGKYHPDIAQATIRDWAGRSDYDDPRICEVANTLLTLWITKQSTLSSAMESFRELLNKLSIESFPIQQLAASRPEETVKIILDSKDDLSNNVMANLGVQVIKRLPMDLFLPLFKRYPCIVNKWSFKDLAPEQQLVVYHEFREGWRDDKGILNNDIIAALPKKERIAEARRHIKLGAFEAKPVGRVPYIAFLPWDEALPLQTPFIRDSDADIRGFALREQIAAAKWNEDYVPNALQLILYRKNEQDPVKTKMMLGLNKIPLGRWKEEHLKDLAQIIRNTYDSGDTSSATICLLLNLVTDLTSNFPEWSKIQLEIMMRDRDEMPRWSRPSGTVPNKDTMVTISEAMSPKLKKLLANKNGDALTTLATGFGTHTKWWTELLDTCEASLKIHEMFAWQVSMVNILKTHKPKTWHRIIPQLISDDTETSGLPVLLEYVHRRQQTLLWDNYILGQSWWTKKALHGLTGGFFRWTREQQAGYASLLLGDIANNDKANDEKCRAIKQLGLLSYFTIKPLIEIANDNERPVLQEEALRTLGRLDGDQGVPTLIDALGDQRARIAIYALRNTLKTMSKTETLTLLKSIPQTKITVAKETLRLIGDLDTEEAFQYLLSRDTEDLHHDVRVALFRALWSYMNRPETWAIFMRAASNPEPGIAKAVCNIPEGGMSTSSQNNLFNLMNALLSHPSAVVRLATLARLRGLPLQDPDGILFPNLLSLITGSRVKDEVDAAARAMFKTYAASHPAQIKGLYEILVTKHNQKVITKIHDVYLSTVSPIDSFKHTRPTTHLILDVLKGDRLSVMRRVKTMFGALPWLEIRPLLFEIVEELHPDVLVLTESHLETNGIGKRWMRESDREDMKSAERELAKSEDERARRLALSLLIRRVRRGKGWNEEQRERLKGYRRDESVMVAEAAWGVDVGEENEEDGPK